MKIKMNILLLISMFISVCCSTTETPDEPKIEEPGTIITIDVSKKTHKVLDKNPGGVVSCWLLDSDIERPRKTSFTNAMKDMGVKYIRFPYGHLGDNYLWDADGDWGNKLTPKVATFTQTPGSWTWAVNQSTGEFIKDMDFDEYISICKNVGAEPMVVVNILSYKYKDGPTYEQLKKSAIEWVRYANITKKYGVKRWALGNEVDHHPEFISQAEYKALYSDFAKAMKEVDPSIWIGPGLLGNWHAAMLAHDPANIDFICAHNYLFGYDWADQEYEGWKTATDDMMSNVAKCQTAVNNSTIPNTEIHVTEMNSYPWVGSNGDNDDLFRALAYGEMVLNACSYEDVKATYVWNTHGPWGGENANASYNILDLDNNREPRGDIIKLINENLLDHYVDVPRVTGFIRSYASIDESNKNLILILINKNSVSEKLEIKVSGFASTSSYSIQEYTGSGPYDESPELSVKKQIETEPGKISLELKAVSMTVIKMSK